MKTALIWLAWLLFTVTMFCVWRLDPASEILFWVTSLIPGLASIVAIIATVNANDYA